MRTDVANMLNDLSFEGRPISYEDIFQSAYVVGCHTHGGYTTSAIREALRLGHARIVGRVTIELTDRGRAAISFDAGRAVLEREGRG